MSDTKPQLLIPLASWQKLFAYTDLCDGEVTGFFDVEWNDERKAFIMEEVYLIEQEAGAAHVEMDEDAIAEFNEAMIAAGKMQMPRGWWHSHVNMQAFFSGTDDNTIDIDFQNDTFTVSLVVNKRREMKCSIVYYNLIPPSIEDRPYLAGYYKETLRIDDCLVKLDVELDDSTIADALEAEVKAKVKSPKTPTTYQHQGSMSFSKKNPNKKSNTLPKDKDLALEKVETLDLYRQWDSDFMEMVYVNRGTGEIWRDSWKVITWEDYKDLKGEKALFAPPTDDIIIARRCINCSYYEGFHKDDLCQREEYDGSPIYDDDFDS